MTRPLHKLMLVAALAVAGSTAPAGAQQPPVALPPPNMMDAVPQATVPQPTVSPPMMMPPIPLPAELSPPSPMPDFDGPGWPHPADVPGSLFRQAPATSPYECAPIPGRYFERDPLVDPPAFAQPGFVADFEVQTLVPHIYHDVVNTTSVGSNAAGTLAVPVTGYDWAVSPRIEIGYRLPSGFGEFLINYQYIRTYGSGTSDLGPDGFGNVNDKFEFNLADFDYATREFTPWQHWGMKWRFGLRSLQTFYRSGIIEPLEEAVAGSHVYQEQGYNAYHGYGAHVAVELDRDFYNWVPGLSLVTKVDFGNTFGFIHQSVSQLTTDGSYDVGAFRADQASQSLYGQLGLNYHASSRLDFYAGGSYGYWWNLGKFNNVALTPAGKPTAKGDLSLTGITFRVSWNY
jgi:hypothetical protein